MSYILDALRRAEAQRERGGVPDIYALPPGSGASLPAPSSAGSPPVRVAAAVVVVLAALLLAWWLFSQREPVRDAVTMAPVPAAMPAPVQPAAPVVLPPPVQLQPPAPVVAAVPLPAPTPTPAPAPAVAPLPAPVPVAPAKPAAREPKAAAATQRPAPATAPATAPAAQPAPAAAPAVNEPRIYTREELPGDIRGQLPQVRISGSSYSENPSSRMLIANGQVFYENEKIAPDTTLVQIRPNSAILSFRGFRYNVPF